MKRIDPAVLAALLLAPGCSVNPVSRRPEVVFVSEEGKRLAVHAPRENIEWKLGIVDLAEPNAFALPGGWVYVSRGILEIANSEDELALVIAHEIVHVAARHHAERHARATGVGMGAVLEPGAVQIETPAGSP